jgi:hypothetical protein
MIALLERCLILLGPQVGLVSEDNTGHLINDARDPSCGNKSRQLTKWYKIREMDLEGEESPYASTKSTVTPNDWAMTARERLL